MPFAVGILDFLSLEKRLSDEPSQREELEPPRSCRQLVPNRTMFKKNAQLARKL